MTRLPLLALALALPACGDPDAPTKCDALVEAICTNGEEVCSPSLDADTCLEAVEEGGMRCEEAIDVSDTYDDCLADVESSDTCLLAEGLPEGCEGTILYLE